MAEEKASKFDQAAYIKEFIRQHHYRLSVVLNRDKDSDIIEQLEKVEARMSRSSYVKQLIRKDIQSESDDQ